MTGSMAIFAHRGLSGEYPENTMAAFRAAWQAGAKGIELDVQLTKDGQVAVVHDEKIERTTDGIGYVKDFTFEQLRLFDAGAWFSASFAGESIPPLTAVFQWVREEAVNMVINVELKNDLFAYEGLEEKVLALVEQYELEEQIIISSFNSESLKKVRNMHPKIAIGYLIEGVPADAVKMAEKIGANAIHCEEEFALSDFGKAAIEAGFPLRVYTVNDPAKKQPLIDAGVEVIMTDFPAKFK